jgi:N-methylhydantoinase B
MREVLGGGSGGRYYSDGEDTIHVVPDSRNLPTEFTESRFPFRVERLGLAVDSGGAGRYRGGLGYEKHIRMLKDGHFMSIADRSILACWGVKGGKAGKPFQVTIDPGGPNEREIDALADAEVIRAGEVVRIRTTGGGGWGDPLDRPITEVVRDVSWGKVSIAGARDSYGVVVTADPSVSVGADAAGVDGAKARRGGPRSHCVSRMRAARDENEPFFDRGPGYAQLSPSTEPRPRRSTGCESPRRPRRQCADWA